MVNQRFLPFIRRAGYYSFNASNLGEIVNVLETTMTEALRRWRIIPVIVIEDPKNAPNVAASLLAGGLPIAEITLRTKAALEALKRIKGEQPEMFAGCGTVLNVAQAKEVKAAGAEFVISPGFNRAVVEYCLEQELPVYPGVATASEIEGVLQTIEGVEHVISIRMTRWWNQTVTYSEVMPIAPEEIVLVENDPSRMESGSITFTYQGGRQ